MNLAESRPRLLLVAAAVVLILGITAAALWHRAGADQLTLYGNIDIREVTLGFRVGGRVSQLLVDEGDSVREGQPLARLDATPLELERDEARANAGALGARATLLRSGYRSQDVEQARAALAERSAAATNAQQLLARQQQLKDTGAISQRIYDDAVAGRDQALARLKAAEQAYDEARTGYRKQEVAEGEANHARAEALLAESEQRLADTVLVAPADGIVLTRAVEKGAILAAGTPVFTLSLVRPVWARVYVNERDLGRFGPNTAVLLHTDSAPGRAYHGQVGFVSPTAEFTPKNVETPDLRTALVYRARVVVSDPDDGLRQGMPVTVTLAAPR